MAELTQEALGFKKHLSLHKHSWYIASLERANAFSFFTACPSKRLHLKY